MVDKYIVDHGVRYFSELTNLAILTEEVGELARLMARKYGDQSFKGAEDQCDIGDEIADVLWVLVCISNQTGVNLSDVIKNNMVKKINRDRDRHRNNEKLK